MFRWQCLRGTQMYTAAGWVGGQRYLNSTKVVRLMTGLLLSLGLSHYQQAFDKAFTIIISNVRSSDPMTRHGGYPQE